MTPRRNTLRVRVNRTAVDRRLDDVRRTMERALRETALAPVAKNLGAVLGGGRMLRSRLILRVGPAAGTPAPTLTACAAAVELMHAASLLHDDVIDRGLMRRGLPAFWVQKGIPGAILLGDLLVCRALSLAGTTAAGRTLLPVLIRKCGEMCEAESEQELLFRHRPPSWKRCVSIARRKTGSLFSFAGLAAGGGDRRLCSALEDAGYAVGTAYQLADDLLDAHGRSLPAGKTLGNDARTGKTTAASAWKQDRVDPRAHIRRLCRSSSASLAPWPRVHDAWLEFMTLDLNPAIEACTRHFSLKAVC